MSDENFRSNADHHEAIRQFIEKAQIWLCLFDVNKIEEQPDRSIQRPNLGQIIPPQTQKLSEAFTQKLNQIPQQKTCKSKYTQQSESKRQRNKTEAIFANNFNQNLGSSDQQAIYADEQVQKIQGITHHSVDQLDQTLINGVNSVIERESTHWDCDHKPNSLLGA